MKTLIISAGHYPAKSGASWNGLREHDYAVKFVDRINQTMTSLGYNVEVVPTGGLTSKVNHVNSLEYSNKQAIAVELHFNSAGTAYVEGAETLYYPGSISGKNLANRFHSAFVELAGNIIGNDRGVKEGWHRMDRPGIIDFYGDEDGDEMPNYWLRKTRFPALILEPCFMCQLEKMEGDWTKLCDYVTNSLIEIVK